MLADAVGLAGRVAPSRVLFGPHETNLDRRRETTPECVVTAAETDPDGVTVTVLAHLAGVESRRRYDGVVCVLPEPEDPLWRVLSGRSDLIVHRIGDCMTPRRVPAAIVDGHRVGVSR